MEVTLWKPPSPAASAVSRLTLVGDSRPAVPCIDLEAVRHTVSTVRHLPLLLLLLLGLVAPGSTHAQSHVLVGVDDTWRFTNAPLAGPLDAVDGWTRTNFVDQAWYSGRSGLGNSAYGEQTKLVGLPGDWHTTLFRRTFVLSRTDAFRTLVLRVDYRDGFVAYLNGREITRRNLLEPPGTPVDFGSIPTPRRDGSAEWIAIGPSADQLQVGTNVLAFEVHSDSDADRPLLVPELLADFPRGPYLQHVLTNQATVLWQSALAVPGKLWLAESNVLASVPRETPAGTNHEVTVTDLLPGHSYTYAVGTGTGVDAVVSDPRTFRTLPASGPLVVTVIGDSGAGSAGQFDIARLMAAQGGDLVLHMGDIVYPQFIRELTDTRFLSVYRKQMATTPFAFVWGNHDLYAGTGPFLAAIRSPTNDTPATNHVAEGTLPQSYYSFDAGDVHFTMGFQTYLSQYVLTTNSAQYRWLDADLAATTKPWKIMAFHHPRATSGSHRYTDINFNGIPDWQEVGPVMMDLARRHGVQLLLAGHDHTFERFLPQAGVHSLITGGGGTVLYSLNGYVADSVQFYTGHHDTRLFFEGDTLKVRAVGRNGQNFDGFNIQRAPPPPGPHAADWATPTIETRPADNGDGNIVGQTYDFYAAPEIKSLTGAFSNLGRARMSVDKTNLYLGLEFVILPPDADIYVFIQVPGIDGVASLEGLGNGIPDPAGEGVDALDFLANLSFGTFFRPSIACVLGDEFADGNFRAFQRPGVTNGLGQGVFRLEKGFPSVPGIRLQQFNRSPQDSSAPPEQGADFIELGIPRSALGVSGGAPAIHIGIVVARGLDVVARTRDIDTGFVGNTLDGSGFGPVVLRGLEVNLAVDPDPDDDGLTTTEELKLGLNPNNPDTDGDGLNDGFEVRHGLNPKSAVGDDGPDGDPDGDGFTNLQEQAMGSDPHDAASPPPPLSLKASAAASFTLAWPALVGRSYTLQGSTNLAGPWTAVAGFPRKATRKDESEVVTNLVSLRFYRVRTQP